MLNPWENSDGYLAIELRLEKGTRFFTTVHVLVMRTFCGPCPDGMEVNHKNGIKSDNLIDNLEYVTHDKNVKHAKSLGLLNPRRGEQNGAAKLDRFKVQDIRARMEIVKTARCATMNLLAKEFGVSEPTIQAIVYKKIWNSI